VSSEEGQLRTAEADLELARSDLERSRGLAARKVISKAEIDSAESKFKQKEGAVNKMRAMVGKKEVRVPFDGQLGIRQVNVGQMINAGQQVVALTALDPVYVDFALPQQELAKLSAGFEVRVHTDAVPGREFKGKLTAVNSTVDTVTRNVTLQATLENPDHALRPGTFAKVEVMLPEKHKALVVPGSAISYAPFGDSVFVIEKKKDPKTGMEPFTELFIKRAVLGMVVSFGLRIAGLQAMKTIDGRQYPRSDIAASTVTTVYVGADAELVRGFITAPLERAIAAADGIDYIQSQSQQGVSTITARLKLNYDANKALSDISSKVDAIRRDLPPEAEIPVIAIQAADSQFASAYLSFTSNILQPNEVTDYLVRLVQPRLTAVGGVQKADILGGRTFAMRVWMKPERMAALNISPADVRSALTRNNYLAAVGSTKGSLLQVNLTANTDLHTADQFKQLVVRQDKGTLIRLGDIADVVLGAEDYNTEVRFSGQKAVFMGIWVLPNANSVDVIK